MLLNWHKIQPTSNLKKQWDILKPQVITLVEETTTNKFNEEWEKLRPTIIQLSTDTTIEQFNRSWEELRPQVIELSQQTTSDKFDEKWEELQPTLTETVTNLVNTNLDTFKNILWQEVTKNDSFPFLLPENFGAVGDGTTDDSTAFNNCFAKAMETGKYILLSNKTYLIEHQLFDIENINLIGINTKIKLGDNAFIGTVTDCYFKGIFFYRELLSINNFINNFFSSQLKLCTFKNMYILFKKVLPNINSLEHVLLDECYLYNTCLNNTNNNYNGTTYLINNTTIKFVLEDLKYHPYFISGIIGGTFIFNNCTFDRDLYYDEFTPFFYTRDNLIFNNCNIKVASEMIRIIKNDDDRKIEISFNNCIIENLNKLLIKVDTENILLPRFKIVNSKLNTGTIILSHVESSLWLENNTMDTKPIINSGPGKVNLVEIQQKYSDTSENIFPWTQETPTVENNVSIVKDGTTDYYVLTENEDKTIKKLDYYFKYDFEYLPNAPYYTNNTIFEDLDLEGYTVKRSLLSNNTCKLKNKSTGELIDYVYLMLDDNVTVTTTKDNQQVVLTEIGMKYLPYFAKLKTDTPATGQCNVDACISIILEKTSS